MKSILERLPESLPEGTVFNLFVTVLIQAACLIPVIALAMLLFRRSSASTRHLGWLWLLLVLLLAPIVTSAGSSLLRSRSSEGSAQRPPSDSAFIVAVDIAPVQQQQQLEQRPLKTPEVPLVQKLQMPSSPNHGENAEQVVVAPSAAERLKRLSEMESTSIDASVVQPAAASTQRIASSEPATDRLLVFVWIGGIVCCGLRVVCGEFVMRRMVRTAQRVTDQSVLQLGAVASQQIDLTFYVALLTHRSCTMPMTYGIWRPMILLPQASLQWPPQRLQMVLLHELAHVKRRDCLWQLLAHLVTSLHWFNPLAWLAASRLRNHRELACDDAVLNSGVRASDYAQTLLDLSTGGRRHALEHCAGLAMARPHRLAVRVEGITDERRSRLAVSRWASRLVGCGACLMTIPLGLMAQAVHLSPLAPAFEIGRPAQQRAAEPALHPKSTKLSVSPR